jgi:prepilin-type N-terminal cleavage/methylation domain-containing protein
MKKENGFSLLEVMTALLVITIGILGVASTYLWTLRGAEHGAQMGNAVEIAQTLVGLITTNNLVPFGSPSLQVGNSYQDDSGLFDAPKIQRPLNYQPFANNFPVNSPFTRNIHISLLGQGSYEQNIAVIKVQVFWKEKGAERDVTFVAYQRQP